MTVYEVQSDSVGQYFMLLRIVTRNYKKSKFGIMELAELLDLYKKANINLEIIKQLKSGKDADLYIVRNQSDQSQAKIQVLKVYKQIADASLNRFNPYLEGRKFTGGFSKVIQKSSKRGKAFLADLRVKREYNKLRKIGKTSSQIPKVIKWIENSLLMEFIGKDQVPAKRLDMLTLSPKQASQALSQITDFIIQMARIDMVHADLSAFNILYHQDKVFIIDFPQTVDIATNPDWIRFYDRDVNNVLNYFRPVLGEEVISQSRAKLEKLRDQIAQSMIYNHQFEEGE